MDRTRLPRVSVKKVSGGKNERCEVVPNGPKIGYKDPRITLITGADSGYCSGFASVLRRTLLAVHCLMAPQATADRAQRQVEVERQLVEQGRKRVDGLLIELAHARIAAMISGCEAAVLRTQLAALTEHRPWWRRRFR
jgi:hypothetical protein